VFSESVYRFAGRAGGGVLSLVALHLMVNYLGTARWGEVAAAAAWVGIFSLLGEFGVATAGARDLPTAGARAPAVLAATFVLGAAGSLVACAAAFFIGSAVYSAHPGIRHLVVLSLPLFPFAVAWIISGTLLASNRRSDLRGVLDVLSSALLVAAALVVVGVRLGPGAYVIGTVAGTAVTAVFGLALLRQVLAARPAWRASRGAVGERLRATGVIGIVVVTGLLYRYVDTVLLSLFSTERQVGEYAVAYQVAGFFMSVPAFVLGTSVTRYVAAADEDRRRLIQYLLDLFTAAVLPGGALLVVLAHPVIRLISGAAAPSGTTSFVLLSVATMFMWVGALFTTGLVWSGNERFAAYIGGVALALNVAANVLLDRRLGARGASTSMIASEVVISVASGLVYCRRTHFRPSLRIPVAAAACAAAIIGGWELWRGA
jgi:PST family polysaccharide transporter